MRLVLALLTVVALACAAPAAADPPTEFPIFDVFPDINPCTGTPMTVTFVGTLSVQSTVPARSISPTGRLRRVMGSLATERTRSSITAKSSNSH